MRGLWKRILCVAIALCMILQPVAYVQAEGEVPEYESDSEKISFEVKRVNPLYKDVISEDDLNDVPDDMPTLYTVPEYVSEKAVLGEQIREMMVVREELFTIYAQTTESITTNEELGVYVDSLVEAALVDTDIPYEGDYLRWQHGGCTIEALVVMENGITYLDITIMFTYYTTSEQEKAVNEEVHALLANLGVLDSPKSDYEKTKAIYDYICSNVVYDHEHLGNDKYTLQFTAYAALIDKTAVCQGYAVLLYRMLEEAGVEARVVTGDGGGPHAWNISEIDETYYYSDSTWDAGVRPDSYKYFLKGSGEFEKHTPDEDSFVYQPPYSYLLSTVSYVPNNSDGEGIEHAWGDGEVTIPATCTEAGEKTYTCICGCGEIKTETIPATGHNWDKNYTIDDPAGCEWSGSKSIHCSNCDETKDCIVIPKLGHKFGNWIIDTVASCIKDGNKHRICGRCGEREDIQIILISGGHNYKVTKTTKATTKKNGKLTKKCTVCAKATTETLYRAKSISLSKTKFVYNGKSQKPKVVVKDSKGRVISSSNYKVSFSKGCKNVGTYKVTVKFKGQYSGKLTKTFKITKAKQVITASNFTKKKGDKAFSIKAKRSSGGGKLTYKSSNKKIATVSSKGKVTIKKAGKVTITITAAANKNYKKATKKITVTVNPK